MRITEASSPATVKTGETNCRMVLSISASRMKLIDCWAEASRGATRAKIVRAQRARRSMLDISKRIPAFQRTIGHYRRIRQCAMVLAALALASCGASSTLPKIDTPRIRLAGYAAGDEPRAVKAAQDILAQGGTVADAGVALAL